MPTRYDEIIIARRRAFERVDAFVRRAAGFADSLLNALRAYMGAAGGDVHRWNLSPEEAKELGGTCVSPGGITTNEGFQYFIVTEFGNGAGGGWTRLRLTITPAGGETFAVRAAGETMVIAPNDAQAVELWCEFVYRRVVDDASRTPPLTIGADGFHNPGA